MDGNWIFGGSTGTAVGSASASTTGIGLAAAAIDGTPRWARVTYGASGPLIGFLGVAFGPFQTLGSLAAIAGGAGIAFAVRRTNTTNRTATP